MNYLLLVISISSMVTQDSLLNFFSKKKLNSRIDTFYFNSFLYLVVFLLSLIVAIGTPISVYSVLLGLLFGTITFLTIFCKLTALSRGPLHLTVMIVTSSMILPAMSDVLIWHEPFHFGKAIAMLLLLLFIRISLGKDHSSVYQKGWLFFCFCAFLGDGTVGIMQTIHQRSTHQAELFWFLSSAFFCAFILSGILTIGKKKSVSFKLADFGIIIIAGGATFAANFLNLKLSGVLPSQLFFPLINGSSIIITGILSVTIFREKFTIRQLIGMFGGLVCLTLICVL